MQPPILDDLYSEKVLAPGVLRKWYEGVKDVVNKHDHRRNRVCVDFDGVITQYDGWHGPDHFDPPTPGIREFLRGIQAMGYAVCIYTARVGVGRDEDNARLFKYLMDNDIPYDEVWLDPQKPPAHAYVDDRAVHASWKSLVLDVEYGTVTAPDDYWSTILYDIKDLIDMNKGPFEAPKEVCKDA